MPPEDAGKPRLNSIIDWLHVIFCGICMGAADIVPGISGGTVAFIIGIYDNLLASIKSVNMQAIKMLLRGQFNEFSQAVYWKFLVALIGGIAFSLITLARLFDYLLGHEVFRIFLYSSFMGLILASVVFCAKQLDRWKTKHFTALACGALIAYLLSGTHFSTSEPLYDVYLSKERVVTEKSLKNYDVNSQMLLEIPASTLSAMKALNIVSAATPVYSHADDQMGTVAQFAHESSRGVDWKLVLCGAIAISAMLLPGISGSYLLTILGVYSVIIGALADFIEAFKRGAFDIDAFLILASTGLGILIGALLFSHVVSWLLSRYRNITIATLTGFMIGALGSVWPFWSYEYVLLPLKIAKGPQLQVLKPIIPSADSAMFWLSLGFAALGFCLVFLLEYVANRKTAQIKNTEIRSLQ